MMIDTMNVCFEREIARCQSLNQHINITSPNIGTYASGSIFGLAKNSTTPSRVIEYLEWIIVGSGLSLRGNIADPKWSINPVEASAKSSLAYDQEYTAFNTAEDIQWLRNSLELGMADLASLFGVTRKAAYDWIGGAKTMKASYIHAVRSMLEKNVPLPSRPYLRQFWNSSPAERLSLAEIIRLGDLDRFNKYALVALGELMEPITAYATDVTSKSSVEKFNSVHNDDIYRSL